MARSWARTMPRIAAEVVCSGTIHHVIWNRGSLVLAGQRRQGVWLHGDGAGDAWIAHAGRPSVAGDVGRACRGSWAQWSCHGRCSCNQAARAAWRGASPAPEEAAGAPCSASGADDVRAWAPALPRAAMEEAGARVRAGGRMPQVGLPGGSRWAGRLGARALGRVSRATGDRPRGRGRRQTTASGRRAAGDRSAVAETAGVD